MKRLLWLLPVLILGIVASPWLRNHVPEKPRPERTASSGAADSSRERVFHVPPGEETAIHTRDAWVAHTPLGKDRRPVTGEAASVGKTTVTHDVPAVFTAFDAWLQGQLAVSPNDRTARLAEGRALLAARQELWPELARSNPEAALMLTPSPVARAALPPDMAAQLEQIVSGVGFYGVKAICNHESTAEHGAGCRIEHEVFINGRSYQASIYGTRSQRLTEESASIYGVALGGLLALHEDDLVILPAAAVQARAAADQLALIYRGINTLVTETQLEVQIQSLLNP
jgi:hypothetical protein